ncbi:MAG: hypothetical protein ACQEXJ_10215 [Myxococcota bacterium]
MDEPTLFQDSMDLLRSLDDEGAEYIIVGAHALAAHGIPRATGDFDVLVRPSRDNAHRVVRALRAFGAPLEAHGVSVDDFVRPGTVYQLGLPPRRIDLLTSISGVDFRDAWDSRLIVEVGGRPVPVLGRDALVENKRATGRDKDALDLKALGEAGEAD